MDRYVFHSKTEEFARRIDKETGQIESICLHCFATVARSHDVTNLAWNEALHDCPAKESAP